MKARRRPKKLKGRTSNTTVIALVAGVVGLAAVFVATQPRQVASVNIPQPVVKVTADDDMILLPTPTRSIARGERVSDVTFAKIKFPKSRLSGNYVTEIEGVKDSVALTSLPKFLPIPSDALSGNPVDANAVVEGIPADMRAITVRVDAEAAVEGWARSGNFVDVILIRAAKKSVGELEAKVIAENVRILSAGRSTKPLSAAGSAPEAPRTVTLLTSQEDALKIKAAGSIGKLTFALRGQGDQSPTVTRSMSQARLLGTARRRVIVKPKSYKGFAKGPNGRMFILDDDSRWIEAEGEAKSKIASVARVEETSRAQLADTETSEALADVAEKTE